METGARAIKEFEEAGFALVSKRSRINRESLLLNYTLEVFSQQELQQFTEEVVQKSIAESILDIPLGVEARHSTATGTCKVRIFENP